MNTFTVLGYTTQKDENINAVPTALIDMYADASLAKQEYPESDIKINPAYQDLVNYIEKYNLKDSMDNKSSSDYLFGYKLDESYDDAWVGYMMDLQEWAHELEYAKTAFPAIGIYQYDECDNDILLGSYSKHNLFNHFVNPII